MPRNEAFMIHDLKRPFRIGINTHSQQAIENSLRLYQYTVRYLMDAGYSHVAQSITLAIYNNRTGEVKQVHPAELHRLYWLASTDYSIDHRCIHLDM